MKLKTKGLFLLVIALLWIITMPNKSEANSEQAALWFMKDMNITQVPNGDVSHANTQNFDVVGVTSNDIFAPFDCKIVAIYPAYNSGNTVVIQSLNKVRFADGSLDIMSMGFAHDNDISDCYVGKVLKQGEVFYQNGDYGLAYGVHTHVTCIRGEYMDIYGNYVNNMWAEQRSSFIYNGVTYTISSPHNDIAPTSALFITESTNIYNTMGLQFEMFRKKPDNIVDLGNFSARIVAKENKNYVVGVDGLDVKSNVCLQKKDLNDSSQLWQFIQNSDNSYIIKNAKTGFVLDVINALNSNATNVWTFYQNNLEAQRWFITSFNGGYRLVPQSSWDYKSLDVQDALYKSGTNIFIYESIDTNHDNQTFLLLNETENKNQEFPDVKESKWYTDSIKYVSSHNIMNGYTSGPNAGKFGLNDTITRGQIATVLYRIAGEPNTTSLPNPFKDVPEGKYYTEPIKWAFSKGITTGKTATSFDPNGNVTRQELATFMARYAKEIKGLDITSTYDITGIADYKNLSSWAIAPMRYIMEKGVITGDMKLGYPRILPKNNATRAEAATMFMRFCLNIA